jgi:hypothetical protein
VFVDEATGPSVNTKTVRIREAHFIMESRK